MNYFTFELIDDLMFLIWYVIKIAQLLAISDEGRYF